MENTFAAGSEVRPSLSVEDIDAIGKRLFGIREETPLSSEQRLHTVRFTITPNHSHEDRGVAVNYLKEHTEKDNPYDFCVGVLHVATTAYQAIDQAEPYPYDRAYTAGDFLHAAHDAVLERLSSEELTALYSQVLFMQNQPGVGKFKDSAGIKLFRRSVLETWFAACDKESQPFTNYPPDMVVRLPESASGYKTVEQLFKAVRLEKDVSAGVCHEIAQMVNAQEFSYTYKVGLHLSTLFSEWIDCLEQSSSNEGGSFRAERERLKRFLLELREYQVRDAAEDIAVLERFTGLYEEDERAEVKEDLEAVFKVGEKEAKIADFDHLLETITEACTPREKEIITTAFLYFYLKYTRREFHSTKFREEVAPEKEYENGLDRLHDHFQYMEDANSNEIGEISKILNDLFVARGSRSLDEAGVRRVCTILDKIFENQEFCAQCEGWSYYKAGSATDFALSAGQLMLYLKNDELGMPGFTFETGRHRADIMEKIVRHELPQLRRYLPVTLAQELETAVGQA